MKKNCLALLAFLLLAGCDRKQIIHDEFPDTISVKLTPQHVRFLGTNFFVIPPAGFVKTEHNLQYQIPGKDMQNFSISRSVIGVKYPLTVEELKAKKTESRDKVLVAKKITYNGMPGLYSETLSMDKFYTAEILVPLKDGSTLFITGNYNYESSGETVSKILTAMQQALFDESYTVDYKGDRDLEIQLDDTGSAFKLSTKEKNGARYYTLDGKACASYCTAPYLIFFDADKITQNKYGNNNHAPDKKDFPSYQQHLKETGFVTKQRTSYKEFSLNGNPARESLFNATDINGESILLLMTEVSRDFTVIVTLGVASPVDTASIAQFRKLSATLKIVD
ncbi:MAG: hypothetical protein ABIR78_08735 [Ferruginibacter sp.]